MWIFQCNSHPGYQQPWKDKILLAKGGFLDVCSQTTSCSWGRRAPCTGLWEESGDMCHVWEDNRMWVRASWATVWSWRLRAWRDRGQGSGMFPSDSLGNFSINTKQKSGVVGIGFPLRPGPDGSIPLMKCTQFILPTLITWRMSVRFLYPSAGSESRPTSQALRALRLMELLFQWIESQPTFV